MSEYIGPPRMVRILRHTFKPNNPLYEELSSFIEVLPNSGIPNFKLTSTRVVMVDSLDFNRSIYDEKLRELNNKFQRSTFNITLGRVGFLDSPRGDLHIRFMPLNRDDLDDITYPLNEITPYVHRSPTDSEVGLDLRIRSEQLVDPETEALAKTSLITEIKSNRKHLLYSVYPNDISGIEQQISGKIR